MTIVNFHSHKPCYLSGLFRHNTNRLLSKPAIEMSSREMSRIVRFEDSFIAGKLMAMGILPQAQIELIRRNALGHTFVYRINSRFKIALRRDEAVTIIVEPA